MPISHCTRGRDRTDLVQQEDRLLQFKPTTDFAKTLVKSAENNKDRPQLYVTYDTLPPKRFQ
ncbi:hypothetical protein BRAS3843_2660018 [Bradyrhizobium sp. STM 3843]|nr:hypothetical protein BRAS3843_2660018 [Bradyrhizobium sp. STM 3843]